MHCQLAAITCAERGTRQVLLAQQAVPQVLPWLRTQQLKGLLPIQAWTIVEGSVEYVLVFFKNK